MSIVEILMQKDGNSRQEAEERVWSCKKRLYEEDIDVGDYDEAKDIVADELGLEHDYMMELLF